MASRRNVVFKEYDPRQVMLLPPSLDELISKPHAVRVVDSVIDQIDIGPYSRQCSLPNGDVCSSMNRLGTLVGLRSAFAQGTEASGSLQAATLNIH